MMKKQLALVFVMVSAVFLTVLISACNNDSGLGGGDTLPKPTKPTAKGNSPTSIRVSWTTVSGAVEYRVYRGVTSTGRFSIVDSTEESTYLDSGLSPASTFYYKITAVNADGLEGPRSDYVAGATNDDENKPITPIDDGVKEPGTDPGTGAVPGTPGGLSLSVQSSSVIQVSWNAVSGAAGYKLYRSTGTAGSWSVRGTIAALSYTDTGLSPNTTYFYRVAAINTAGEGTPSENKSALTVEEGYNSGVPTGVNAVPQSPSQITLTWTGVADALGYNIYRSSSAAGTYDKLPISPVTAPPFNDGGLSPNTTYFYKVSALRLEGESSQSSSVNAKTPPVPDTPVPSGLAAVAQGATEILVSWEAVSDAEGYNIYRSSSAGGTYSKLPASPVSSSPYTDEGLTMNTTYYYKVSAIKDERESAQSAYKSAKTLQAPVAPPGSTLAAKLDYIAQNGGDGTVFNVIVDEDVTLAPRTITTNGRNIVINLYSYSAADIKTISLGDTGSLFTIDSSITLKLENIILKGRAANNSAVVKVNLGGKLVMEAGTRITGNTNGAYRDYGAGVRVENGGTFMMYGGVISSNSATYYATGGGVAIATGGTFTKTHTADSTTSGTIYGSGAGDLANTAETGAAVYYQTGGKRRTTTLGEYDEISTANANEGWD